MKAKELAELLMENPDLDVEVYHTDVIYVNEVVNIERTYHEFDVNIMYDGIRQIVQITCLS